MMPTTGTIQFEPGTRENPDSGYRSVDGTIIENAKDVQEKVVKTNLVFDISKNKQLLIKVGISGVDMSETPAGSQKRKAIAFLFHFKSVNFAQNSLK